MLSEKPLKKLYKNSGKDNTRDMNDIKKTRNSSNRWWWQRFVAEVLSQDEDGSSRRAAGSNQLDALTNRQDKLDCILDVALLALSKECRKSRNTAA